MYTSIYYIQKAQYGFNCDCHIIFLFAHRKQREIPNRLYDQSTLYFSALFDLLGKTTQKQSLIVLILVLSQISSPLSLCCCAVLCLVAQSCPTLWDPMDHKLPGSSVRGDFPGKNTEVAAYPFSRGTSRPRNCRSPALRADSLPAELPVKLPLSLYMTPNILSALCILTYFLCQHFESLSTFSI